MDIVRYLAGLMIRSIRATAGRHHAQIEVEGHYSAFLNFENGATSLLLFNKCSSFAVAELTWDIGEGAT
jgi:hypothetical protein